MNIFEKYSAYIKDNPEHLWFKRKLYGWGWTPATWQGWMVIFGFLVALALDFFFIAPPFPSPEVPPVAFLLRTLLYVIVLLTLCYKKARVPAGNGAYPRMSQKGRELWIQRTREIKKERNNKNYGHRMSIIFVWGMLLR